jgi:hypothetical protein
MPVANRATRIEPPDFGEREVRGQPPAAASRRIDLPALRIDILHVGSSFKRVIVQADQHAIACDGEVLLDIIRGLLDRHPVAVNVCSGAYADAPRCAIETFDAAPIRPLALISAMETHTSAIR